MPQAPLAQAPLGRSTVYPDSYDPSLLFPIDREHNRAALDLPTGWHGADIWNAYELSWLNAKGKPMVALARFTFPCNSPRLIESKSFKLYLNSFTETRYNSGADLQVILARDLGEACGAQVNVELETGMRDTLTCRPLEGICIDDADIEISQYEPAPRLLRLVEGGENVSETLVSELLKSNCPVTGQPDWGSVQIRYTGPQIDRHALLRYIVSLRRHTEFHEHCVEKMYCDIQAACQPQSLLVYARYTRRGGLDINPWRSSERDQVSVARTPRQ